MTENIFLTAGLFALMFIAFIKFHGDDKPCTAIMVAEVIGFLSSVATMFISGLFLIWQ